MNKLFVACLIVSYHLSSWAALSSNDVKQRDAGTYEADSYDLEITELGDSIFKGELKILLNVTGEVEEIQLIAAERYRVTGCEVSDPKVSKCTFKKLTGRYALSFAPKLNKDRVTLKINYDSRYNDYDRGLYLDDTGTEKIYLSKGKKLLFPYIYGENATISLNYRVAGEYKILSHHDRDMYSVEEEITLVIGRIEHMDSTGLIESFGIINENIIDHFTEEANFIYQFLNLIFEDNAATLTQVGLPIFSAPEVQSKNFITYSDRNFYMKTAPSFEQIFSYVDTIGHHLLHQWFGIRTVSQKVWMDEGVKTFFPYLMFDESIWKSDASFSAVGLFVVDHIQSRAFEADGFLDSKALDHNPAVIEYHYENRDPIRSSKGAAVVRSFFEICGLEEFKNSLKNYLKDKGNNFDLMHYLTFCIRHADGNDYVRKLGVNPGYPVIHVTDSDSKRETESSFELKQERFLWQGDEKAVASWCLPITYSTDRTKDWGTFPNQWFCKESFGLDLKGDVKWIVLNNQQSGYYRVNYPARIWKAIHAQLEDNHLKIHEMNRAQIIDDIFSFARSTHKFSFEVPDYKMALNLTEYLKEERSYFPLKAAFNSISFLDSALYGEKPYGDFRSHIRNIVEALYSEFGLYNQKDVNYNLFIVKLVSDWACKLEIEKCTKDVASLLARPLQVDPMHDVKEVVFCSGIRSNLSADLIWDNLHNNYKRETNTNERLSLLRILSCSKNEEHVNTLLNEMFEPSFKRFGADIVDAILNAGPENGNVIVKFLQSKKTEIAEKLGTRNLGRILFRLSRSVNAEGARRLLETFKNFAEDEMISAANVKLESIITWSVEKVSVLEKFFATENSAENRRPFAVSLLLSVIVPIVKNFIQDYRIAF